MRGAGTPGEPRALGTERERDPRVHAAEGQFHGPSGPDSPRRFSGEEEPEERSRVGEGALILKKRKCSSGNSSLKLTDSKNLLRGFREAQGTQCRLKNCKQHDTSFIPWLKYSDGLGTLEEGRKGIFKLAERGDFEIRKSVVNFYFEITLSWSLFCLPALPFSLRPESRSEV